jgi:hypothetical protein
VGCGIWVVGTGVALGRGAVGGLAVVRTVFGALDARDGVVGAADVDTGADDADDVNDVDNDDWVAALGWLADVQLTSSPAAAASTTTRRRMRATLAHRVDGGCERGRRLPWTFRE